MTNPDRDELVKLADRLAALPTFKMSTVVTVPGVACNDRERDLIVTALLRLASSDSAVKGEPEPVAWPANLNPRTLDLVQRFALALAKKLRLAEEKYGHTDGWSRDDWEAECRDHLYQHLEKGDPRDVAAYCAFMWHHGWITYRPAITAPPADAGMREALELAHGKFCKIAGTEIWTDSCLDGWRRSPGALRDYAEQAAKEIDAVLTAPGATKSDVEALAATTAERPGTVTSEPEPSTSDSARDDVPLGYERVTDCTTLPGDNFRYALDNNGVTGKVIGHFRPIKPGPSDPSSTRSEVTLENVAYQIRRALVEHYPAMNGVIRESVGDAAARALLDQFAIRRK